jgi:hypothetical protein
MIKRELLCSSPHVAFGLALKEMSEIGRKNKSKLILADNDLDVLLCGVFGLWGCHDHLENVCEAQ